MVNLVKDSSFEKGYAEDFWIDYGDVTLEIGTESYLGNKSLCIEISEAEGEGGAFTERIAIEGERTVTFSAYVKTTSKAFITISDINNNTAVSSGILDASSVSYEDWTRLEASYTSPEDTEILLELTAEGVGTAYMDCVQRKV